MIVSRLVAIRESIYDIGTTIRIVLVVIVKLDVIRWPTAKCAPRNLGVLRHLTGAH